MINFKTESELAEILKSFDAPKLTYKDKLDAGPDEELYFFEDNDGNKYGLWSRDYMSELKYEANGLKNDFDINLEKWVTTTNGEAMAYSDGYWFALFKIINNK